MRFIHLCSKLKLFYEQISIPAGMFPVKNNTDQTEPPEKQGKPRILLAPLDWGLGHATRCIPLIRELLAQGADLVLGGSGLSGKLLQAEFPQLPYLEIPSASIRYSRKGFFLPLKILLQTPAFIRQMKEENRWLRQTVEEWQLDAIISDNRYGLYHPGIPSVLITHQLAIKTGLGKTADGLIRRKNYRQLKNFSSCWIPDTAQEGGLAGELAHPDKKPVIPYRYIGPLTRFSRSTALAEPGRLLILLSGPEPQRTQLEERILKDLHRCPGLITLVRGVDLSAPLLPSTSQIRIYNQLPAAELEKEMQLAEWVISRTGYTTLMDIFPLRKKSILIPTPGQPEQEYLGLYHGVKRHALVIPQEQFHLLTALDEARSFPYSFPLAEANKELPGLVSGFLRSLHR